MPLLSRRPNSDENNRHSLLTWVKCLQLKVFAVKSITLNVHKHIAFKC